MRSKIILTALLLILLAFATSCNINQTNEGDVSEESQTSDITDNNSSFDESESVTEEHSTEESETECLHIAVYEVAVTVETCKNKGYYKTVCRDCGETVNYFETEPVSHTEGDWTVEKEPTPEEKGLEYTSCRVCGEKMEREIYALGYSKGLVFASIGEDECSVIARGECTDSYIRIPPTSPDGKKVTAIAANAFEEDEKISALYIPDTVTVIGNDAFSLSTVREIRFSDNITLIADNAFFGCDLLEAVDLPEKLAEIGSNAFNSCVKLTSLTLPEGLVSIGGGAFSNCKGVTELHIPASVSYIGEPILSPKTIKNITVDEKNAYYKVVNNCLICSDGRLIVGYGECSVPAGVTTICKYAFMGNSQLTAATIPSSVKEIGDFAFSMTGIAEITIPYGVRSVGNGAFEECEGLSAVVIPITVEKIGYWAFDLCPSLATVKYYGSEASWGEIDIHADNEGLDAVTVEFIEEVSPDSVYGYGRTTISGKAAMIYDMLDSSIMCDEPVSKLSFDLGDELTIDDFNLARQIFLSDHPECFWWRGTVKYYYNSAGYVLAIEPVYTYSGNQLVSMRSELESVVSAIIDAMPEGSVFDKALYLHDEVAKRVTYTFTDNDQTPYGALVEGRAVCNGYATAYQMLLQRAGIRAWTVNGTSRGENHAWNVVWIAEDICVYTDVTWDDQSVIMHYYFNMSLDEIDDDHNTNIDFALPECSHTEYGYDDLCEDSIVIYDTDGVSKLNGRFVNAPDGGKMIQIFYMGENFDAWLSKYGMKIFVMTGGDEISYMNVGNEYVIFVK